MSLFTVPERLPPITTFEPSSPGVVSRSFPPTVTTASTATTRSPSVTTNPNDTINHNAVNPPQPVLPPVSCIVPPPPISLLSPVIPSPVGSPPREVSYGGIHPSPASSLMNELNQSYHYHSEVTPSREQHSPYSPSSTGSSSPTHASVTGFPLRSPVHQHHHKPLHHHHPYSHPSVYQQSSRQPRQPRQSAQRQLDPASELLAEKRRRNAGASARFRDRRKQRERDMQEKCQFLERRVQELENMDNPQKIVELECKLEEANAERDTEKSKIARLEEEITQLRIQLLECEHELMTPSSSSGESDTKEYRASQSSRPPFTSAGQVPRPTDVRALLL